MIDEIVEVANDKEIIIEDINDLLFMATNEKVIKKIIYEQLYDVITKEMTDEQKESFEYGVNLVMSLISQMTDITDNHIVFYNPDVEVETEMDINEVLQWFLYDRYKD